jgi:hypothetical protein
MVATTTVSAASAERFELRFESLYSEGRGLAFPCNPSGRVDPDELPERARDNYFFARAMVGREFYTPKVARAA